MKKNFFIIVFFTSLLLLTSCNNSPEKKLIKLMDYTTIQLQEANSSEEVKKIYTVFINEIRQLILEHPDIAYDMMDENNKAVAKASIRLLVAAKAANSKFSDTDHSFSEDYLH